MWAAAVRWHGELTGIRNLSAVGDADKAEELGYEPRFLPS